MDVKGVSALVTGGASGLGKAAATRLVAGGADVTIVDLPTSDGPAMADELGPQATFVPGDVTDAEQVAAAVDTAAERGPFRVLVHCAGRGGPVRVVEKDGSPGPLDKYIETIRVNLIGTFNTLRLAAARMSTTDPVGDERGVCILTASVAAFEGQIGQV